MNDEKIFFSVSHLKVMTAKHLLSEAGIEAFTVDKMDSAHAGVFGDIQLHVSKADEDKAREILEKAEIL